MTNIARELQAALLTRLRECEAFSKGVAEKITDQERDDYPFAWVAVTQSAEDHVPGSGVAGGLGRRCSPAWAGLISVPLPAG